MTTRAPREERRRAVEAPMPFEAPVIRAVLLARGSWVIIMFFVISSVVVRSMVVKC